MIFKVVSVNKDGSAIFIEQPPKERGGDATKAEVQIGPKTGILYQGVPLNGAKPTEGYYARVDLDGERTTAKVTAKTIVFQAPGNGGRGGAGMFGIVKSVKDKGVILQVGPLRAGGVRATDAEFVFDAKTVVLFSNVEKDGAKIVENMAASVQLVDGTTNNTAGVITFSPQDQRAGFRREKRPEVYGKLVSSDDKSLTIETGGGRGEEPVKTTVKLGAKAELRYFNVVAGAAKPAEGMTVQVWLADGSKDEAANVMLSGTPPQRWATIQARVVSAAADGSTITIEQPPTTRGEEAKQMTIKLPKEAKVSFSNVGPGEATPKEGYGVMVRLADDSKDTAAEANFLKPGEDRARR